MVHPTDTADMAQLEAEEDRWLARIDDVYLGYLFVDMSVRRTYAKD